MIPDSFSGLLLFLAAIGPGYVFLRVAERREPRQARSTLLEFAELFVIGAATTAAVSILVLLVATTSNAVDFTRWLTQGREYFVAEPTRILITVGLILVLSYLAAWQAARLVYRGRAASIRPEFSVWFQVFHVRNDRQSSLAEARYATLELRDGRRVAGYIHAYTLEGSGDHREIALRAPISAQASAKAPVVSVRDDFLVIPSEQILYVGVQTQQFSVGNPQRSKGQGR